MRTLLLGILLAVALGGGGGRAPGSGVSRCSQLVGDAARACYTQAVAADLGAPGAKRVSFAVTTDGFVCDLHKRIGVRQ